MNIGGGYSIDLDISKSVESIPHDKLRELLGQRVSDGAIQRVIGKWLSAGVMEEGTARRSETGSPPGGVISPLLSNR
jgi:retron-type reverse transcriptase